MKETRSERENGDRAQINSPSPLRLIHVPLYAYSAASSSLLLCLTGERIL